MSANRLSGLFVSLFGLALFFIVIPFDTEAVDYGWVRPATVPSAAAVVLTIAGAVLAIAPSGTTDLSRREFGRAGIYLALAASAVFLLQHLDFLIVAPAFALILMLLIGERRPLWLILGAGAGPGLIWFAATQLLGRPLP